MISRERALLPKGEHLRNNRELRAVFRQGRRIRGTYLSLVVAKGKGRVAFIASKRVGNAVKRNRARRLLREAYRRERAHLSQNTDIILVATEKTVQAQLFSVESELVKLLERSVTIR